MIDLALRCATRHDESAVLRLNAGAVVETSPMDGQRFRTLLAAASRFLVAESRGRTVGFLIALGDGKAYDSVNYRWFAARLRRFLYVDRVVVGADARGAGVATACYAHVESWARGAGMHWLAAEMNLAPENKASLAFHARRGFRQVATQALRSGKVVSMQVLALDAGPAGDGGRR